MKLTGWYSGDQKPVRVGIYQRAYDCGTLILYCYWDGVNFGGGVLTSGHASLSYQYHGSSLSQSLPWRGVAK
jgi:hypothetical protein